MYNKQLTPCKENSRDDDANNIKNYISFIQNTSAYEFVTGYVLLDTVPSNNCTAIDYCQEVTVKHCVNVL